MASFFSEMDNTADTAFHISAGSREDLFVSAALALGRLAGVRTEPAEAVPGLIQVSAGDVDGLLVDWLNELLWWIETRHLVAVEIRWRIWQATTLAAEVNFLPIASLQRELKAVTFSGLHIIHDGDRYQVSVVVDV